MGNRRKPLAEKQQHGRRGGKVVIAYIHPGETSAYFTQGLMNLLMYDQATARSVVGCLNEWSSANVSAARNSLTGRFLDEHPTAEWLLWVDADMAFEHDALERLLASADKAAAPIVGGLCFGATFGRLVPTIYQFVERDGQIKTIRVDDYPDDTLVACAATGAAFVLIHRTVIEAVRDKGFNPAFPWFQETELAGQPAGEDLTFFIRAGICGFPVHVDTSVRVGHHKSIVLDHDMFRAQRAQEEAAADVGS